MPVSLAADERTYPTLTALGGNEEGEGEGKGKAAQLVLYGGFPAFPSFAKWMGPMGPAAGGETARADAHSLRISGGGGDCEWERLEVVSGGARPEGRHGHVAVSDGDDALVVFGGCGGSVSTNQVWRLKGAGGKAAAAGATWEKKSAGDAGASAGVEAAAAVAVAPRARWRHAACVFRGSAFVFGGNTRDKEAINLNDVWRLDLSADGAASASAAATAGATWEEVPTTGGAPSPRHDHSAVLVNGDHMVVFGGNGGGRKDPSPLGDVHELNLSSGRWRCVQTQTSGVESSPPPRFAHVAVVSSCGTEMLVHGGAGVNGALNENGRVWRLNLQTWKWT